MPIPPTAVSFGDALDPNELLDYSIDCSGVLESGEAIAAYTVELLPEAVALGLTISEDEARAIALVNDDTAIRLWFLIDEDFRDDPAFDGTGRSLPMLVSITTTSTPSRERQGTVLLKVAQK